jgi:hypothetical protein
MRTGACARDKENKRYAKRRPPLRKLPPVTVLHAEV